MQQCNKLDSVDTNHREPPVVYCSAHTTLHTDCSTTMSCTYNKYHSLAYIRIRHVHLPARLRPRPAPAPCSGMLRIRVDTRSTQYACLYLAPGLHSGLAGSGPSIQNLSNRRGKFVSAASVVVSCKIPILATRVRFPGGAYFWDFFWDFFWGEGVSGRRLISFFTISLSLSRFPLQYYGGDALIKIRNSARSPNGINTQLQTKLARSISNSLVQIFFFLNNIQITYMKVMVAVSQYGS